MRYEYSNTESTCPVCSCEAGQVLHRMSAATAAQHYVLNEVQPERHAKLTEAIRRLWQGDEAAWVQCDACGFVHAEPHVGGDMEFYTLAYERTHYPADKWEFRRSVAAIKEYARSIGIGMENIRLLELGAGEGRFVSQLVAAGARPENIVCTDYSEFGRGQIEAMGIRCHAKDVSELTPEDVPGPLDVVCLFQVLEHMDNPHGLLERVNSLAKTGALILVAVPADQRMAFNELHGSLLDMPPNHVGRWTKKAFVTLAERHGWQLDFHEIEPETGGQKLRQYWKYCYLRKMQDPASLANRVERLSASPLKTLLRGTVAGGYLLGRGRSALTLMRDASLGNSQLAQLSRTGA